MKKIIVSTTVIALSVFSFTGCKKENVQPAMEEQYGVNVLNAKTTSGNNTTFVSSAAEAGDEVYHGTFTATGFLTGSGITAEDVNITMPSGSAQALANATYTFSSNQKFTFSDGSITIKTHGTWWFTNVSALLAAGSGKWQVIGSTGAYNGIKGGGTLEITSINLGQTPATVSDIYTGNLSY